METGGKTATSKRAPIKDQVRGRQMAAIAAILLSGWLTGCAGLTSGVKKTIQAAFQVNPGSVSFGKVNVGKQATQTIAVTNTGNTSLSITQVSFSNPQFSLSGAALPMALGTGQSANMTVALTPTSAGAVAGTLTAQGNNGSSPVTVNLSATAVNPAPQISLSASSIQLGTVTIGSTRNSTVTISNLGTADLNVSLISLAGTEFAVSGITTPKTIAAGTSATATLAFQPTTAGAASGTLTITSNDPNTPSATVSLSGTGTATAITQIQASPTSLSFGNVTLGASSTQNIILSNTGTAGIQISSITVNGAGISGSGVTTPLFLNPGASATVIARFAPTVAGSVSGNFVVASDATGSPMTIPVTGTGVAVTQTLSLSKTSLSFGNVNVGSFATNAVTITNTGNTSVQISQIAVAGAGVTATGITTPLTLNPAAAATLNVKFAPTAPGGVTGSVSVTSNATGSPQTISLTGTGIQPVLGISPASFAYGSVVDGQAKSQTFTLTNNGTASLTISRITASGTGYRVNGLATPTTLAAGASATFNAVFAPTTAGTLTGTVTITSNAPGSPTTVALSGAGVANTASLSANPTSLAFGSVSAGTSSSQSVTLTNSGNTNVTLSQITLTATDTTTSGVTLPVTLTPGQTQTLNVTFSPKAQETVFGNVTVSTTQGAKAVVTVSGTGMQAKLSLTPSSANLGSVTVGSSNSQTMQISNPGNAVLTITQANVTGSAFSTSGLTLPLSVNAGSTSTFNVVFQPTVAGLVGGNLSLLSNAAGSPTSLALSGTGVAAKLTLSFSATNVNFGNVSIGSSSTNALTITNTGNSNVQISGITISGAGYTLGGASTPVTLTPSQTMTFSMIFTPTVAGTVGGSVTVASNTNGSPSTITLSGTGVTTVPHTVSLSWTASTTSGVVGYNVYRSTTNGTGYTKINSSLVAPVDYTDNTVANGTTYYYVTTALDGSGNESPFSNQATAVIP